MSELPTIQGNQAIAAFSRVGFSVVRIKGSHHVMKKPGHVHNLVVPVHGSTPLKPGTLRSLIRAAGLTVDQFVQLLDG
jgi:predicted RNA binding protein YcfA (HicA-like mRNA interferase family)